MISLNTRFSRRRLLEVLSVASLVSGLSAVNAGVRSNIALTAPSSTSLVMGRVIDAVTDEPVSGVTIRVEPAELVTSTDELGHFEATVPVGSYDLYLEATGYIAAHSFGQRAPTETGYLQFVLFPEELDASHLDLTFARLSKQPQVSPPQPVVPSDHSPISPLSGIQVLSTLPASIVVRWPDGRNETVELEEYVKGVVPNEMPASWATEALRAQAVAARSYGVAYYQAYGYVSTTAQLYNPAVRYATTDAAVDATRGVVARRDGSVIWAFYSAKCNGETTRNSENALHSDDNWITCYERGWSYVPYCRARPCGGHTPHTSSCGYWGHGVGMCQFGAQARASQDGMGYDDIIHRYYSGVSLNLGGPQPPQLLQPIQGALVRTGLPVNLAWSASGSEYAVQVYAPSGGLFTETPGWISQTQWTVTAPSSGQYRWRVKSRNSALEESGWSEERNFIASNTIYRNYAPIVIR